ncbi:ribulose-phosphate 3-epimerase [Companilactobacillus huachuanensis]|uniref:Ribulose-phosphate 3-epimerase n=1 Tax=Companilactobacillus huachuanensis TaxID=2559914 RepID=A0ABW1RL88_9LACO|nr:ribulose-phosphate 3-epimerase [Companilactobacillus huachuanensis]
MATIIAPSLMCADFTKIKQEVNDLDDAKVDIFHMDVMDGNYVPNVALGVEDYKAVRKLTKTPMDVHLMVQNPDAYVNIFAPLGANIIYVHPDTSPMITRTLDNIRKLGIHPGIAVNPSLSIAQIEELLPLVDYVLVMTVNPGFAGQKFLDYTLPKIEIISNLKAKYNFKLMVDGAISPDRIKQLSGFGVDGFIVGTSSLFGKKRSYKEIVSELKGLDE